MIRTHSIRALILLLSLTYPFTGALAADPAEGLSPADVHVAEPKKTQVYVREGMFVGGDRAIDRVTVKEIRRAANAGYERIVIDLEGNRNGEPAAVQRPPYFQITAKPDQQRLVFSIWGNPQLQFDPKKVIATFKKSRIVEKVEFYPKLEENLWTFSLLLKSEAPIEVFELVNPVRIIIDIRTPPRK